jgi:hypothetical protein
VIYRFGECAENIFELDPHSPLLTNVNNPFRSRHNEWVTGLRSDNRFRALMAEVKREWAAINSIGRPLRSRRTLR